MANIEIKKNVIELLKKIKIKSLKEFKNSLQSISWFLDRWISELDSIGMNQYEKCHVCQMLLGYPRYWSDNFIEINFMYYCEKCDYFYCKDCGNIHKKRHIDERRLEMYEAKRIYRRNKLFNKTKRYNNERTKQITLLDLKERQIKIN